MKTIICVMGPTASGKTPLAVSLVSQLPAEIISVDSAMVYRGMNIGTAKPTSDILKRAPHRLIDLIDPSERYSAGQFRKDALIAIQEVIASGKTPLLVGGTMLYFRVLTSGLATLPRADEQTRTLIAKRREALGDRGLHEALQLVDPLAAARIHQNDAKRVSRALEVYALTGKPISEWQQEATSPLTGYRVIYLGLIPDRAVLHERIERRFDEMLAMGLVDEVRGLYTRGDLNREMSSMQSVGYKEVWSYLSCEVDEATMREQAIAATRQLAKRQLTWLRSWPDLKVFDSEEPDLFEKVRAFLSSSSDGGI